MLLCEDVLNAQQNAVGCHNHVTCFCLLYGFCAVGGKIENLYVQCGRKAFHFHLPVRGYRCWSHHERGTVFFLEQEECDGLDGFTQTHVVGQQCSGSPAVEPSNPQVAVLLIGPQGGIQFLWNRWTVVGAIENFFPNVQELRVHLQ